MKAPQRLVVRGVNWLGDAVMSMPAIERLRAVLPQTHIALLTADKLEALWQGHPAIDEVITFSKQKGLRQVSQALKQGNFDAALILPNSFRSAFESWLARIPVRVGYGRSFLLTHSVPPRREHVAMHKRTVAEVRRAAAQNPGGARQTFPRSAHHLHQYLRLASFFGASQEPVQPRIQLSPTETSQFRERFLSDSLLPRIGLNPGAEYGPAKRWPVENFIEVSRLVSDRVQAQWLIFGGPGDKMTAEHIESGLRGISPSVVNLAGRTNLRELIAGLSLCEAVLTNDTGPMHLAAAVGSRLVVPFGSTSPELTGPGLPDDPRHQLILGKAPCAPCFRRTCPIDFRCMKSISPSAVAGALLALLER